MLSRFDYGGISFLIAGSNVPAILYTYYCDRTMVYIYGSLIGTFCFLAFVVSMIPKFDQPAFRPVRGFMFIGVGLLGAVSIVNSLLYE